MSHQVKDAGNVKIVEVTGRLVLSSELVKETVQGLLAGGHNRIVIDLRGVSYIDSSGLGDLVACKKRVLENNGLVRLVRTTGKYNLAIEAVIELAFGPLYEHLKDALGSF